MPAKKLNQPEKVPGYDSLPEGNQKLFAKFLIAFTNAWGTEARATLKPLAIKYCNNTEGKYLRFDYEIYGRKDWLHVCLNKRTNEIEWY